MSEDNKEVIKCSKCGECEVPRFHSDYERPLEFLCESCTRSLRRAVFALRRADKYGTLKNRPMKQLKAAISVARHQGPDSLKAVSGEIGYHDTILLQFRHILIGIEKDGHAHS